jgi:hypothetical protein
MNANTDSDNGEVELSADDLRALSVVCASTPSGPATSTANPVVNSHTPSAESASPSQTNSRLVLSLALVLGVSAVIAFHTNRIPDRSRDRTTAAAAHRPTFEDEWADAQPPEEPVRFANPFDASEVFEFSPGTTESEAREAVAGFLIERATNRQARLDGKAERRR